MLRQAKTETEIAGLLNLRNKIPFTTYMKDENGESKPHKVYEKTIVGGFWQDNRDKIQPYIDQDEELSDKIDNYYIATRSGQISDEGKERRRQIYAEMLRQANTEEKISKLLKQDSVELFTRYMKDENGKLKPNKVYNAVVSNFFHIPGNRNRVLEIVFGDMNDRSYDLARKAILKKLKVNSIEEYYEKQKEKVRKLKETKKQISGINNQLNNDSVRVRKV